MQKHVRIVLSILQNFLAISVDRILSALKTTQLFETEIVWKYVLKDVLSYSKFNGNCMPLKTIVSPISILLNALLQCIMLESLQQIYGTMGIHLYQLHHHWVTSWRSPQTCDPRNSPDLSSFENRNSMIDTHLSLLMGYMIIRYLAPSTRVRELF